MPVSKAKTGKPPPEFGFAEFWSFCSWLFLKQEFSDAKAETGKQSKNSALQNNAKSVAFCSFCAFTEKNAVSLAKPDCKGALAHKNPFLTKRREPKPPNSAYAEFGYRLPVPDKET